MQQVHISFASGTWMGVFQQLMSARLRFDDFIFILTVMSHDRLAVPSGGLVLCLCTCYIYKRSRDLGIWSVGYREAV